MHLTGGSLRVFKPFRGWRLVPSKRRCLLPPTRGERTPLGGNRLAASAVVLNLLKETIHHEKANSNEILTNSRMGLHL